MNDKKNGWKAAPPPVLSPYKGRLPLEVVTTAEQEAETAQLRAGNTRRIIGDIAQTDFIAEIQVSFDVLDDFHLDTRADMAEVFSNLL